MDIPHSERPTTVWIRHQGRLHRRHIHCRTAGPYAKAVLQAWRAGQSLPGATPVPVCDADHGVVRVQGGNSPEDPMFSPDIDDIELPACGCEHVLAALTAGRPN